MIAELAAATGQNVSRETAQTLTTYIDLLRGEALRQNLIAKSTLDAVWQRHILDSAQLLRFAPPGRWADVGSGAGLPGMVLAILSSCEMNLIEPRKLRAEFLRQTAEALALGNVTVTYAKVEQVPGTFDVITARAVAPLSKLLGITAHLAHAGTTWALLKGRNAKCELAEAQRSWHYDVRVEPSCTQADSSVLLLSNVRAKRKP